MNRSSLRSNSPSPLTGAAVIAGSLLLLGACSTKGTYQQAVSDHWSLYGPVLRSDPPTMTVSEIAAAEVAGPVVLTGVVRGVCQTKGCWMTVAAEGAETPVFVKFRDYGFFVPRNAVGRQVVLNGAPVVTEVSVQMLRHYGRDAGRSEEEVMLITEPERRLEFIADSVLIHGGGLMAPYAASMPEVCEPEPLEGPAIPDVDDFRPSVLPGSAPATPPAAVPARPIVIPDIDEYRQRPSSATPSSEPLPSTEPAADPSTTTEEPAAAPAQEPAGSSILDD